MAFYNLKFDRVAERLIYQSIKQHLIDKINFPSGKIYLQSPYDQYVNSRTETIDNKEEGRYPAISIYGINFEEDKSFNCFDSMSQIISDTQIEQWDSDLLINATIELCAETTTVKDDMIIRNKIITFLDEARNGLPILFDTLPKQAGFTIHSKDVKIFVENDIRSSVFTLKVQYKIYRQYVAYTFNTYDLLLDLQIGTDTLNGTQETIWNGNIQNVIDLGANPPNLQDRRTILRCINTIPINTAVDIMSSGIYFTLQDTIPDLRLSVNEFNTDVNIQFERNGLPQDKGIEIIRISASQVMFSEQIDIGEVITIYS